MLHAEEARLLCQFAEIRRSNPIMFDRIEYRIRGAALAGHKEVVVDLQGSEMNGDHAEKIAIVVRNDGYAVRVERVDSANLYRMTISWA